MKNPSGFGVAVGVISIAFSTLCLVVMPFFAAAIVLAAVFGASSGGLALGLKARRTAMVTFVFAVIPLVGWLILHFTGYRVSAPADAANSLAATDAWVGQWTGPEGTFLRIEGGQGKYQITIRDLDASRIYTGMSDGTTIRFDRNGVKESIHATNGEQTGMKWLQGKTNCLTVREGEGYCRDAP